MDLNVSYQNGFESTVSLLLLSTTCVDMNLAICLDHHKIKGKKNSYVTSI